MRKYVELETTQWGISSINYLINVSCFVCVGGRFSLSAEHNTIRKDGEIHPSSIYITQDCKEYYKMKESKSKMWWWVKSRNHYSPQRGNCVAAGRGI